MPTPLPFNSERGFSVASGIHGKSPYRTYTIVAQHPGLTAADITSNGPYTLWTGPTVVYPWLTSAQNLELVSTSVNDTAAGTGARQVYMRLLNDAFEETELIVPLNGTTPVPIPGGPWYRVNFAEPWDYGSGQYNEGVVTVRVAGGGAVLSHISNAVGRRGGPARQFIYTVPAGFWLAVDTWLVTALTPNGNSPGGLGAYSADLRVRFQRPGLPISPGWADLIPLGGHQGVGTQTVVPRTSPQLWTPGSDVEVLITACTSPGTLYPAIGLNMFLVPDDVVVSYPPGHATPWTGPAPA